MSQHRQLAAIMFTDIVGYTALMGEDEQRAFEIIRINRHLQQPLIKQLNGVWIKEIGDGILASFHTVTDAVLCAVSIQQGCAPIPDLKLRIGIHLGEVIFENNDVFGDSVNIAARLQALAPVGGVWISEPVYKNIANKKGVHSTYIKEENLKNVREPVKIYELNIANFDSQQFKHAYIDEDPAGLTRQKKANHSREKLQSFGTPKQRSSLNKKLVTGIGGALVAIIAGLLLIPGWIKKQNARNILIPEIQRLSEADYFTPTRAFDLAKEAEAAIPNDSVLLKLWPRVSWRFSFRTNPAGAEVSWKDYNDVNGKWKFAGTTPFINGLLPKGFLRLKIEKKGFKPVYCPGVLFPDEVTLELDSINKYPETMAKVNGAIAPMLIVGLERYGTEGGNQNSKFVHEFLIDKYEVTNKEFKKFIDAGGYATKKYWERLFYRNENQIPWEQAMSLFQDKTGKPGPADWEVGSYPEGKDNYPVTGVSWYEAMAYANYAGKTLPTVYHWSLIANTWSTGEIVPKSNFNSKGTVPVGSLEGINYWGTYDVGGNAREWCQNESNRKGYFYILGGGWNDPGYAYNDAFTQPALDRSLSNGFRCMQKLTGDTSLNDLTGVLNLDFRNYTKEKPVDEKTFNIFLRQYAYDQSPLNAQATLFADTSFCKIEKIDFDAAYNKEKLSMYLYLPKNISPPYQTIVFYPGSQVITQNKMNCKAELMWFDYLLKSGRAICYPILKGTFDRGDQLRSDLQDKTIFYKDHVIMWHQDIGRSLDYLETRKDIVPGNFGYYGFSWGSAMMPIMCATEKRFKAALMQVGGLMMQETLPEADPWNFLPRVTIPVLMLNGKNDTFYPSETSQKPMFELFGTDRKDKQMIEYAGGHVVPRSELIKESLTWFDKYLGKVK